MTPLIKKAHRGNKEALATLYDANKKKVFYLCSVLLCDADSAESACIHTFKSAWQFIIDGKIESERELESFLINKAVTNCKLRIAKSDSKAFKIPQNKNFIVSAYSFNSSNSDEEIKRLSLVSLPAIHRFIYVLDAYLEWSHEEIAELLYTRGETVKLALDSKKNNFERFAYAFKQEKGVSVSFTEKDFDYYLFELDGECVVDSSVDEAVLSSIDSVIAPILTVKKRKRFKVGLIVGISLIAAILLTLGIVAICLSSESEEDESDDEYDYYEEFDELNWITQIESPTQYAIIDIANYGKITLALDSNSAPKTVENFVNLASSGFYNGLTFHRIIEGFMMQGGDPNGDGTGGYLDENGNKVNIEGEFYYNGYDNLLSHTRGAISMARAEDYDSASSQFFIVHEDCSADLDGGYAVFGFVIDGIDVVDAVCAAAEPTDDNGTIEEAAQPVITSIKIYTPDEYSTLKENAESEESNSESENQDSTDEAEVAVIEAIIAEVSAISVRDGALFITAYSLNEDSSDYKITDAAKIDFSKYKATEKIERYSIASTDKVYEVKDGALVELDASGIAEGDMLAIYTDSENVVNVVVYRAENTDDSEDSEESEENNDAEKSEDTENTDNSQATE